MSSPLTKVSSSLQKSPAPAPVIQTSLGQETSPLPVASTSIFTILQQDLSYLKTLVDLKEATPHSVFSALPQALQNFGTGIFEYLSRRDNQIHLLKMFALSTVCGLIGKGVGATILRSQGLKVVQHFKIGDLIQLAVRNPQLLAAHALAGSASMGVNATLFTAANALISGHLPQSPLAFLTESATSASHFSAMHFFNYGLAPLGPVAPFLLGGLIFNAAPLMVTILTNTLGITETSLESYLDPQSVVENTALHWANNVAARASNRIVTRPSEVLGLSKLIKETVTQQAASLGKGLKNLARGASFMALNADGALGAFMHRLLGREAFGLEMQRRTLVERSEFKTLRNELQILIKAWLRPESEMEASPDEYGNLRQRQSLVRERIRTIETFLEKLSPLTFNEACLLKDAVLTLFLDEAGYAQNLSDLNALVQLATMPGRFYQEQVYDFLRERGYRSDHSQTEIEGLVQNRLQRLASERLAQATLQELDGKTRED